jgi:hypothetical protein
MKRMIQALKNLTYIMLQVVMLQISYKKIFQFLSPYLHYSSMM